MQANKIIEEVCLYFGISEDNIKKHSKKQMYLVPRYIAMRLIRNEGYSLADIGSMFNRHHSTIINSLDKLEAQHSWMKKAQKVHDHINKIEPSKIRLKKLLLDNGLSRGQSDLILREILKNFKISEK